MIRIKVGDTIKCFGEPYEVVTFFKEGGIGLKDSEGKVIHVTGKQAREIFDNPYLKPIDKQDAEDEDINHPHRYAKGSVECIDAIESATSDLQGIEAVCVANAIKYLWRFKEKEPKKSLLKARWYLNRLIDKYEQVSRNN